MQLVLQHKEQVTTTSLLIAQKFEKEHKDVLKAIKNLECSDEFRGRNFARSSYKSTQNKDLPMYIITRDGFSLLVMGFTGSKAMKFKEDFIAAFNAMEEILREKTPTLLPTYSERILSEPCRSIPKGHWTVFDKCHPIMLLIEKYVGSINRFDLVDGSIGRAWSAYRKNKDWAVDHDYYNHHFSDRRGIISCKCYTYAEFEYFEEWLVNTYKPKHLYSYLYNKYKGEKDISMLRKVEKAQQKLIGLPIAS